MKVYQTNLPSYSPMITEEVEVKKKGGGKVPPFPNQKKDQQTYSPYPRTYNSNSQLKGNKPEKKDYSTGQKKYPRYLLNYQPMAKGHKKHNINSYFEWSENTTKSNWLQVISKIANFIIKRLVSPFLKLL